MSDSRQPLLQSQGGPSTSGHEQNWSSRVTDRLLRLVETASGSLDAALQSTSRRRSEDMARPRSSQQQADLATQSADPRHTSGDALDQSLEGNDEERSNASPRQETAAASAERHRVNDGSIIDLPALVSWVETNILFALILLNLFITLHWSGVAIFALMTLIIAGLNRFMRHQIGLKEARQKFLIAAAAIYTTGHATTFASPSRLILSWQRLSVLPSRDQGSAYDSVWQCFYDAILADGLARFATITVKLLVILFSSASPEERFQQRSRVLNAVEHVSLCLRLLVTTPFWLHYFQTSTEHTFFLYTGVYLCLKFRLVCDKGAQGYKAVRACWSSFGSPYGVHLNAETLLEEGQTAACPICQEPVTKPLQLTCKHVFCEACISEWLEREPTCPMCRSQIKTPNMAHKDGAVALLPQIF